MTLQSRRHSGILACFVILLATSTGTIPAVRAQSLGEIAARAGHQPSIRAIVAPPANAAGWHNSSVAIAFDCRNAVSCPGTVILDAEGAGQHISRSITAADGRTAETDLVINIDKSQPAVRIVGTDTSMPDVVAVTARASDSGSGVAAAFCNGRPARVTDGRIACGLAFRDGLTDIAVTVVDRAGNSASAGTQLSRPATALELKVFPKTATIRVGDRRPFSLFDSAWQRVPAQSWMADNPLVATVDQSGIVTAVGEGNTTITGVSEDSRAASMALTVIAPGRIPLGTTLWVAHKLPGTVLGRLLQPPGDGTMISAELDEAGSLSVSSLNLAGEPMWFTLPPLAPGEQVHTTMIDHSGSPLLWVISPGGRSAIVRTGHPSTGTVWRYELEGPATGNWALGWDGTLWIVDTPPHGYTHVTAVDHRTAEVKFRVGVPLTVSPTNTPGTSERTVLPLVARPSTVGPPFVADEFTLPYAITEVRPAAFEGQPARVVAAREVNLLRIKPDGSAVMEGLLGFTGSRIDALPVLQLTGAYPDGQDGTLALMQATYPDGRSHGWVMRKAGESRTMYALPVAGTYVLGEDQAYTTDSHTLVAFDPVSGKVNWTRHSDEPFSLDHATRGGGVVVQTRTRRYQVSSDGGWKVMAGGELIPPQQPR